jgi:hypothetical protein
MKGSESTIAGGATVMGLVLLTDNRISLESPGYREVQAASIAPRQDSRDFFVSRETDYEYQNVTGPGSSVP